MKLFWIAIFFLCIFGLLASAQPIDVQTFLDASFDEGGNLLPEMQGQLVFASQQFQTLPDPVKAIFGNQRVQVNLTREDGTVETLGVVLTNNTISSFTWHAPTNPSMTLVTSESTMMDIAQSENISNAFIQAVNSGKLTYAAVEGGGGEFAVFVANIMTWIMTVINSFLNLVGMN